MVESELSISSLSSNKEALGAPLPLGLVIKVVSGGCNLRCSYCFYSGHQPEIKPMSLDTVRTITQKAIYSSPKGITFIWHGGEPALAGIDFYKGVMNIQKEFRLNGQEIRNDIQTNGVLITEKWANFFKENSWGVGISVDGPEYLHNLTRVDAGGQGTFEKVLESISLLKEKGLRVGAIAVINKLALGHAKEIFDFMYEKRLSFAANACSAKPTDPESVRSLAISPFEYSKFLLELLDLWLEKDDPQFRITPLEDIVKYVLGGRPSLCRYKGVCERYLTVDYNGDVYPCDEFLERTYVLGNLVNQDIKDVIRNKNFTNYYSGQRLVEGLCKSCNWFNICKGGCMREWNGKKVLGNPQQEKYCLARQNLFTGIEKRLTAKF